MSKARGRGRSTTLNLYMRLTKINIKQSPDTGIEPENSDMPGKRATFTPPGHLCFLMHYPSISTHR